MDVPRMAMNLWSSGLLHATTWLAQQDVPVGGGAPAPSGGGGAMAPAAAATSTPQWLNIALFGGMFAVFYFLVMRPQSQRAKKHKAFLDEIKVGSRVVTAGGLFGKLVDIQGNEAKIEIADRVVIKILKSQIAGLEANAAEAVANQNAR
jgi:preprotein translocase subunit YajC